MTLDSGIDGWYIGNIIFGGLLGFLIIDPATGAMWTLDERAVVNLGAPAASSQMPQLKIITLNELSPDLRKDLIPVNQRFR